MNHEPVNNRESIETNIQLINKESTYLSSAIDYFWEKWGSDSNYNFYKDCIENSVNNHESLPKFYIILDNERIIGSYALLTNDIISRQDLLPWFACLFVEEEYRNKGIANQLLSHSLIESHKRGFQTVYLSTELSSFYEKKGWTYHSNGYTVFGDEIKIYSRKSFY